MRYLIPFFTIISLFVLQSCSESATGIQNDSATEFQQNMQSNKGLLIDLRTPEEYVEGHIKGSATINFYDASFESKLNGLDRNKVLYLYCASGGRSSKASKMAHSMEFKEIHNLIGGFYAWEDAGLPVQR